SDFEAALSPLRRAAELEPGDPRIQYNLALTLCQLERFDEARQVLSNAIERWPNESRLIILYKRVLEEFGEQKR
ncbi:MAG: tetratricopeptide repeat protein, partial [Acidobacteriia bacterium]|nr:tetratricopeptide repeat protein [Terriglobia bacterium]